MPASDPASSHQLRLKGNRYYADAGSVDDNEESKRRLLELALVFYHKALDAARSVADGASAHRNIAATLAHLVKLRPGPGAGSSSAAAATVMMDTLRQVVSHRCAALVCGKQAGKSDEWCAVVNDSIGDAVDELVQVLVELLVADLGACGVALRHLSLLQQAVHDNCPEWGLHASATFLHGVRDLLAGAIDPAKASDAECPDWRGCLRLLNEAKRTLTETLQFAAEVEDTVTVEQLLHLEDELRAMTCRCEFTQARLHADEQLERALRSYKQQQDAAAAREGVFAALDLYRKACLLARECDLQAEAHALSRMGHAYRACAGLLNPVLVGPLSDGSKGDDEDSGLLIKRSADERARDAFLRVLVLVDTLPHRISLMMETWYREARDAVSDYQRTTEAQEAAQREKERMPIREALKPELTALFTAANSGWDELLKHVYAAHPPLNPANHVSDFTGMSAETCKEWLRKAILAYHPDKQEAHAKEAAPTWKVLAEEITKELVRMYAAFK